MAAWKKNVPKRMSKSPPSTPRGSARSASSLEPGEAARACGTHIDGAARHSTLSPWTPFPADGPLTMRIQVGCIQMASCGARAGRPLLPWLGLIANSAWADERVVALSRQFPAPGREDEAEARQRKVVELVKAREPNITYGLHRADKPVPTSTYYETCPSQAAFDAHKQTLAAFFKEYGPPTAGLFAKPTETEEYRMAMAAGRVAV